MHILKSVKRLVRDKRSRAYLRNGGWTDELSQARNFSTIEEVVEVCREHRLTNVELVLQFEKKLPEFTLPILEKPMANGHRLA